jgi:hypothetical protein
MGHTALGFDERIDALCSLEQGRISIGDNEPETFAMKSPTFQIRKKPTPAGLVLNLCKLKGQHFPAPLIFSRLLTVNGKSTEHDLPLNADLPDLLANPIQKEKLHRVTDRFVSKSLKLSVQIAQCRTHRLSTDLLAIQILNDPFELTGAHPIEKEPPNGAIHIPTTTLIAVKNTKLHSPWFHARHFDALNPTKSSQKVPPIMAVPVTSTPLGPLVPLGSNLIRKLLLKEIFDEHFDETLYA